MLRQFVCGLVVVALVASPALSADKKEAAGKAVTGMFASYKDGTLTIKVKEKKGEEPKAQDFKVADTTKVTTLSGEDKKEGTAKDAFKDVKEGTAVVVTVGEGDKVTGIQVGSAKKKKDPTTGKTVSGTFSAYKEGTLTIKVKGKKGDEPKAQEFKVADDTKVTILSAEDKKEGTAKDAFKDAKEGTAVAINIGEGDKITGIQIGSKKK